MTPAQSEGVLLKRLTKAELNPDALDLWEGWRVFKAFCAQEVEGVYDAASFQSGRFEVEEGGERICASIIRQFSERDGDRDEGVRRVVMAFEYSPESAVDASAEVWTHDFESFAEFASVVEGLGQFQSLLNRQPLRTEVYSEEL